MSIGMIPFKAFYDYHANSFLNLIFSDGRVPKENDMVKQSKDIMEALKENLQ